MITAPFNFVPLSEKVFFPPWAEDVSHDIPFEDGESGVIDITLTAKSPIFVRDHEKPEEFCQHNGEYYIPSTSIKGMVRSVLEIMSFSKMSQFNDDTYAVRDLNNKELYMSKMKPTNTFCGWLYKTNDGYKVDDCGIPGRIRLDKINNTLASDFNEQFDGKKEEHKTAEFKYNMTKNIELPTKFLHKKSDNGRDIYTVGNSKRGTIVFTGQPSKRKEGIKPTGKIYEFIFFDFIEDLDIEEKVFKNFLFSYFDGRKTQPEESKDWTYWKKRLNNNEKIPIFFQKDKDGKIIHFGLSYLYKLPYKYSIKNAIESVSKEHFNPKADLAQTIFGYTEKDGKSNLKGRVNFSHFKADTQPEKFQKIRTVLGSPRASYYPIYMKQDIPYKTLMDEDTQIAGRKRYPLQQNIPNPKQYSEKEKSATTFNALGTYDKVSGNFNEFSFSGKVRYHNLKKSELGALLSALTFHGNSNDFYHNVGMAKSYGFGKIQVSLDIQGSKLQEGLQEFEYVMSKEIGEWLKTEQIKELFTMADKDINIDSNYLVLNPQLGVDEFRDKKNNLETLDLASKLSNSDIQIQSLLNASLKEKVKIALLEKERENQIQIEKMMLEKTPSSKSKEFQEAIEKFVRKNATGLPLYKYEDLKLLLYGEEDNIKSDMIYDAYINLTGKKTFQKIENLLLKRDKGEATKLELAQLYSALKKI